MQQHIQRPVRRTEPQQAAQDKDSVWPLSAREFMKLPVSALLSKGTRITFTRLAPPNHAA